MEFVVSTALQEFLSAIGCVRGEMDRTPLKIDRRYCLCLDLIVGCGGDVDAGELRGANFGSWACL